MHIDQHFAAVSLYHAPEIMDPSHQVTRLTRAFAISDGIRRVKGLSCLSSASTHDIVSGRFLELCNQFRDVARIVCRSPSIGDDLAACYVKAADNAADCPKDL
jgi:hypothetical protein